MPSKEEVKEFFKYLITDQIEELQQSALSIFEILFKYKSWVYIWLGLSIYGVLIHNYKIALWSLIASVLFLIIHEWVIGRWRHQYREELRKKIKVKYKVNK